MPRSCWGYHNIIYHGVRNTIRKLFFKGVVSSYQTRLSLPSVAKTHPKIYPSQFNLQFCQTPVFRLGVDFVLPLSQEEEEEEEQEEQEEEPLTKIYQKGEC